MRHLGVISALILGSVAFLMTLQPLHAQPITGYVKTLGLSGESVLTGERYVLDITRLRTKGLWVLHDDIEAELWLDTELWVGDFLQTPDYQLGQSLPRTTLLDVDWDVTSGTHHQLRQHLFRAFVTVYGPGQTRITLGRQRVAWGTGFVWNPTDLLNPVDPAGIERSEQGGVDAVSVGVPTGSLSNVEGVVAFGRNRNENSYAVRAGTNYGEYDVSGMAGYFRRDWVAGGDWAGYVGNAGFRGEFAFTRRAEASNYLRAVANVDYTFSNGTYLLIEGFYNGLDAPPTLDEVDARSLVLFNAGRWYGALSVAKTLTPLFSVQGYGIANLSDGSGLAGPGLVWSLAENLELAASAFLFFGASDAEYGRFANIYFGSLQFYF